MNISLRSVGQCGLLVRTLVTCWNQKAAGRTFKTDKESV